jgi:DNA-binding CsgD family transcriptional regulator
MVERARSGGFVALQGACFEADRAQPYAPLLDLVRSLSTNVSPAMAAHYFAPAGAELLTLFPELRSIFPDTERRETFEPEDDRRRLFHSFTEAVHAIGKVQPLLLVIEDVHWSDDATLDLALHVARRIGQQPIALVLTFRSDEVGQQLAQLLANLDRARCASEVGLRPLGAADVSTMLHAIFGSETAFEGTFVDTLHGLTEGNPFFVEEMLKALLVAGDLVRADGVWRARPLDTVRVPRTATEAVGRRLAGLSAAAREVASVAAVAGRRFDFGLLKVLTGHEETELLAIVKELVGAQFVVEESADRFAFRHALTREAMRARLLTRERVALHKAIAAALEERSQANAPEIIDALAYHSFQAGSWGPAQRYALKAAEHALALCAPREALQHLNHAVTATENLGHQPDASLLVTRGRVYETLGAFPQANDNFSTALIAARQGGDRRAEWGALHALGMLWSARDYERAGEYRRNALEVARAIGDPPLIAHSLNRVGNWYVNREEPHSGVPSHEEALAIFEHARDRRGIAETVDLLAMAHHMAGSQETAVRLYERSVELFEALDDRRGLANALAVLDLCAPSHQTSVGPVAESARGPGPLPSDRAVRLANEIGWRAGEAFSRFLLADCLTWRGEYARALQLGRESLAIAQEIEHLEWQCGARRILGVTALDLCATADALLQLEAAHNIAKRLGSATWIRWTGAPVAIALARAGEHTRAAAILDYVDSAVSSPAVQRTIGARYLAIARAEVALAAGDPLAALAAIDDRDAARTPRTAFLNAQALGALGRWTESAVWLGAARDEALRQGARPLLWRIDAMQGTVHLGERRRLDARRSFDAARSMAAELASSLGEPALVAAFHAGVDLWAPPPSERTAGQTAKAAHGGLTRRERDTAALIAVGKSNRAIARALGIGERTVEGYVAAALSKLGFSSRSQIAVWAADQGLAANDRPAERPRR